MAHFANMTERACADHAALLPDGEFGVLVCMAAVPVIWTVLIATLLGGCAMIAVASVVLALVTGGGAVAARLVWLRQQARY